MKKYVVLGLLVILLSIANVSGCHIKICKETTVESSSAFAFEASWWDDIIFLSDGECEDYALEPGMKYYVGEIVPDSWVLEDIQCSYDPQKSVVIYDDDGVAIILGNERVTCTFYNSPPSVPELTPLGVVLSMALILGAVVISRR